MPATPDTYSRVVYWLKIVLPLGALAMLSTMFLIARTVVTDPTIPFSTVDVNDLARDQRLTKPEYTTVTADGAALSVLAETARPATADGAAHATVVHATYAKGQDTLVTLDAPLATLNTLKGTLQLTGGVKIHTTDSYVVNASKIDAALNVTTFVADGPVTGLAPMGHIEAGHLTYTAAKDGQTSEVLVFNKGVRLIYQPKP